MSATAVSEFEAALDAVVSAVEAETWTAARKALLIAQVKFEKLPNEVGSGPARVRYQNRMQGLDEQITRLEAASGRARDNRRFVRTRTGFGR